MHPWMKGIQVRSEEGPCPLPRVANNEIGKFEIGNLKKFKNLLKISTKLGT